jgi:hypothetical protein
MHQLAIFSDLPTNADALHRQLSGTFELRCHSFRRIPERVPDLYTVIDTSLKDASRLPELRTSVTTNESGLRAGAMW